MVRGKKAQSCYLAYIAFRRILQTQAVLLMRKIVATYASSLDRKKLIAFELVNWADMI